MIENYETLEPPNTIMKTINKYNPVYLSFRGAKNNDNYAG